MSGLVDACLAAIRESEPHPRGVVINSKAWDEVVRNAQHVKPRADGLMEFCGFKVKVDDIIPDHVIVWTDDSGNVLHIQDLRNEKSE